MCGHWRGRMSWHARVARTEERNLEVAGVSGGVIDADSVGVGGVALLAEPDQVPPEQLHARLRLQLRDFPHLRRSSVTDQLRPKEGR